MSAASRRVDVIVNSAHTLLRHGLERLGVSPDVHEAWLGDSFAAGDFVLSPSDPLTRVVSPLYRLWLRTEYRLVVAADVEIGGCSYGTPLQLRLDPPWRGLPHASFLIDSAAIVEGGRVGVIGPGRTVDDYGGWWRDATTCRDLGALDDAMDRPLHVEDLVLVPIGHALGAPCTIRARLSVADALR